MITGIAVMFDVTERQSRPFKSSRRSRSSSGSCRSSIYLHRQGVQASSPILEDTEPRPSRFWNPPQTRALD